MPNYTIMFAACSQCGGKTTKQFARTHEGKCKQCSTGVVKKDKPADSSDRTARIIDSGYSAYAREEGHYDQGDY